MEEILFQSLSNYFSTLTRVGYVSNIDTERLMIFDFIYELLDGECKGFITEKDYLEIHKALYCLYGSTCLIPYPEYRVNTSLKCGI